MSVVLDFDAFVEKWVPQPPAWQPAAAGQVWRAAGSEVERRFGYRAQMARMGEPVRPELAERLRRDAAAEVPLLDTLAWLLADPEVPTPGDAARVVQQVFGVPSSRALFIASWRPGNRSDAARRVLDRVALCIADARCAGLWEPEG